MRVKTGVVRRRKHHKVLELTKGFRMTKNRLHKAAQEASRHADQYSYNGRRIRRRDFRNLWIQRINAGLIESKLSYSQFIHLLKKSKIELDRKILAQLAVTDQKAFLEIVKTCQSSV